MGRLKLDIARLNERIDAGGLEVLEVTREHALLVARLPNHHCDPFGRILVAQAIEEGLTLLTQDATLAKYSHTLFV